MEARVVVGGLGGSCLWGARGTTAVNPRWVACA